jgi:hypothetical protein
MRDSFNKLVMFTRAVCAVAQIVRHAVREGGDMFTRAVCAVAQMVKTVQSGVNAADVVDAMSTLRAKTERLSLSIGKADREVVASLFSHTLIRKRERMPETWDDFFRELRSGIQATQGELADRGDETRASLGRIASDIDVFKAWYAAQDRRLLPLFQSLGKIEGIPAELIKIFPKGKYAGPFHGVEATLEIS